jgi:hypothetical protein
MNFIINNYDHDYCEKEVIKDKFNNNNPIFVCKKCEEIQNQINILNDELDEIMYYLPYRIKNYEDCDVAIKRTFIISKLLQQLNYILTKNL